MNTLLSYSLSVTVMLSVLYPIYKIALSKEGFPAYNRGVILSIFLVAMTYMPICQYIGDSLKNGSYEEVASPAVTVAYTVPEPDFEEEPEVVMPTTMEASTATDKSVDRILTLLLWAYASGLVLIVLHVSFMWVKIITLIRSGEIHHFHGYTLVIIRQRKVAPFSWMNYLVIHEDDYDEGAEMIMIHEIKHINCRHWLDILFSEIVIAINWYNPVAWLFQKELRAVHEYQADSAVIDHGVNALNYQMLLIRRATSASYSPIVNSFNQSKLRDRLNMMWNTDRNPRRKWRVAVIIPAAIICMAFANGSIMTEARESLSEIKWDLSGESSSAYTKVQKMFSMIPEKRDSAKVIMSNGETKSVKILNKDEAQRQLAQTRQATQTSRQKTQRQRQEAERQRQEIQRQAQLARQEAERQEAQRQAQLARQEAQRQRQEVQRQAQLARQEAERQRQEVQRQAQLARQEAERQEAQRQAQLARQEAQRQRQEVQRQAQLARQEAERQRQEVQRQAQLARQEAERQRQEVQRQAQLARQEAERQRQEVQRQAQLARQEAQRQAQMARQEAERQRQEAQRQAQLARQEAQRQAQMARQEAERQRQEAQRQARLARQEAQDAERQAREAARQAREAARQAREEARKERERARNNYSYSYSGEYDAVVIDSNGNIKEVKPSKNNNSLRNKINKVKSFDSEALKDINTRDITDITIAGEMPDCTICILAESSKKRVNRTIVYRNGSMTSMSNSITAKE